MLTTKKLKVPWRKRERVLKAATARWEMKKQVSTNGVLIDYSGNGHHGYYGGVKKALIGDTTSGDRRLILPGILGNYASTPDAAALDITGDIDIIAKCAMADWTPATAYRTIVGKWHGTGDQRGFLFYLKQTTGLLNLYWSTNGAAGGVLFAESTAAPTVVDGATLWVRVTMDVNDGAGNRVIEFFTSTDGSTWTKLGNTVTAVGTTSIYSNSAAVNIGGHDDGTSELVNGTIYRAIIKDGIGGTTVLDVDFTTQAQGTRSFVCTSGQTVTVNQSADTAAMPTRLWYSGTVYGWLPGTAGNYFSTADSAGNRPTGDQWYRARINLTDYSNGAYQALNGRWTDAANNRSAHLMIQATGLVTLQWSTTGADSVLVSSDATLYTVGVTDASTVEVAATLDVDNGAGAYVVKFWWRLLSTDAWTQLGSTITGGATTSVNAGTALWECGNSQVGTAQAVLGQIYNAAMGTGIIIDTGTTLSVDFTALASYNATQTTLTAVTGQAVTINRSTTGLKSTVVDANLEDDDGVDDYWGTDDHARLNFAAAESLSIAKRIRVFASPAAEQVLVGKKSGILAAGAGYQLTIDTSRRAVFRVTDGTNAATSTSAALTVGANSVIVGVLNRATNQAIVYVNGVAAAAGGASAVGALTNTVEYRSAVGGAGANFGSFQGKTDDLFRRALSLPQILQLNSEMV